ncbi:MAG TPA: polysaccharide deacetylase family protein [Polyangiaceae bacterium]|nr:polysaccharide deacetylase family protein [Polyangiaceae bacterium]
MADLQGMLTLDVEDWEHANFAQLHGRHAELTASVRRRRYAIDANTDRWIELLAHAGAVSTCFVLGEFAERYPAAVKRLAAAGHELASHGATHERVDGMQRLEFREFLKRGVGIVGDLAGQRPLGFRAPSWSGAGPAWFCDELREQGLRYDSSVFPAGTPMFGARGVPLGCYWERGILRVPATVLRLGPVRLPLANGAFFRLAPLACLRRGLLRAARDGLPAMIVLHPRELDPRHPRLPLRGWNGVVHYARLLTTEPKLRALLGILRWRSIRQALAATLALQGERAPVAAASADTGDMRG